MTLQCDASTNNLQGIYWQTPSGQIYYFNSDNSNFTITDIVASDGGYYTCANATGYVYYSTVIVYVTPYFIHQPLNDVYTSDGMIENVTCIAEAFPSPDVYWITSFESDRNDSESGSGVLDQNILTFSPVVFGDEGVYVCIATNDYGNDTTSIIVTSKIYVLRIY